MIKAILYFLSLLFLRGNFVYFFYIHFSFLILSSILIEPRKKCKLQNKSYTKSNLLSFYFLIKIRVKRVCFVLATWHCIKTLVLKCVNVSKPLQLSLIFSDIYALKLDKQKLINRPGVAGAVLHTASLLIN